jgi:hypothetical protein
MKWRLYVFAITLFLISCTTNNLGLDSGLFSGKPCAAPCWQNLTPGKSTATDVDRFIKTLSPTAWPEEITLAGGPNCQTRQIADNVSPRPATTVADFQIEDEKLTLIQSSPAHPPNLAELQAHLGPPEFFKALLAIGPDGSNYAIEVYYPSQGLAFIIAPDQNDVGYIKPSMIVATIQYFAPGSLLSYFIVSESCVAGMAKAQADAPLVIAQFVQPWSGFGAVKVISTR